MGDEKGDSHYPFDKWLGESTFRESASILKEWTAVTMSHTTVGSIVKRVGVAQAQADEEVVKIF